MAQLVDEKGFTREPLYHGTSRTLATRLRSEDSYPSELASLIGLVKDVWSTAADSLPPDSYFARNEYTLRKLVSKSTEGALNMRYGGLYLTASPQGAVRYAMRPCGSELATNVLAILLELRDRGLELPQTVSDHAIFQVLEQPFDPVVVELTHLPISDLRDEHGNPPDSKLRKWAELLESNDGISRAMLQGCTFEFVGKPSVSKMTILEVERAEHQPATVEEALRLELPT